MQINVFLFNFRMKYDMGMFTWESTLYRHTIYNLFLLNPCWISPKQTTVLIWWIWVTLVYVHVCFFYFFILPNAFFDFSLTINLQLYEWISWKLFYIFLYIYNICVYIYIYIYIHTHTHTNIHTVYLSVSQITQKICSWIVYFCHFHYFHSSSSHYSNSN